MRREGSLLAMGQGDGPLTLGNARPLFRGTHRLCFRHPDDSGLLVKVLRPDARPEVLRAGQKRAWRRWLPAAYFDEQRRDLAAYAALARQGEGVWEHVPRFRGALRTDLGPALVCDLIENADGTSARTLMQLAPYDEAPAVLAAQDAIFDFVRRHRLPLRDFGPYNVVVQTRADGLLHPWLVDGFGDRSFLPLARLSDRVARERTERQIERFGEKLRRRLARRVG